MTCTKFKEYCYLRDNEFDAETVDQMRRHSAVCPACASEFVRMHSFHETLRDAAEVSPAPADPWQMIDAVMEQIGRDTVSRSPQTRQPALELFIRWLSAPAVRTSFAVLLLAITGSFAFDYSAGYVTMKGYEEHLGRTSVMLEGGTTTAGLLTGGPLEKAAELSRLLAGKQRSAQRTDTWVMMNKESLEDFILVYTELKAHAAELPPDFLAAHPGLARLVSSTQDSSAVSQLMTNRAALIHELNQLIRPKGARQ